MTAYGTYKDGSKWVLCDEGWKLYEAWLRSDWPEGDVFDNPEGRAYWQHREACEVCTKREATHD